MEFGIPQGSILEFSVGNNDISMITNAESCILCADDTSLTISNPNSGLDVACYEEFNTCFKYFPLLILKTKASKSIYIILKLSHHPNFNSGSRPLIMIDDDVGEEVNSEFF